MDGKEYTALESVEYASIASILTRVLNIYKIPLSVTFLNVTFSGGLNKKFAITHDFMKLYKDKFIYNVVGNDLKIQLRDASNTVKDATSTSNTVKDSTSKEYEKDINYITQVIDKDLNKMKVLSQRNSKTDIEYSDFIKQCSKRSNINIPYILRNSHALIIKSRDQQTYIEFIKDWNENITMSESEVWDILSTGGFDSFLITVLTSLLTHFFEPINQGTLQSCFNFGSIVIDKVFMRCHADVLEKSDNMGIILNPKSRTAGLLKRKSEDEKPDLLKKLKDESFTEIQTDTKCSSSLSEEFQPKVSEKEEKPKVLFSPTKVSEQISIAMSIIETSTDGNVNNACLTNTESVSSDDYNTNVVSTSTDSNTNVVSTSTDSNINVVSTHTESNTNVVSTHTKSNTNVVSTHTECTPGTNENDLDEKYKTSETIDIKNQNDKCKTDVNNDCSKPSETTEHENENTKAVLSAISKKNSFLVIGESSESLIINLNKNDDELTRQQLLKIRDSIDSFLDRLSRDSCSKNENNIEPEEFV